MKAKTFLIAIPWLILLASAAWGLGVGGSGRVRTSTPYTFTATQTAPEWASSAADNTHFLNVNNSTSHKSNPSTGDIDTIAGLPWIYNGSWVRILLAGGTMTDTKYCTYSSSGGGLICNSEGGSGGALNSGSQYHLVWYPSAGTTGGDSGITTASDGSSITTVQGTAPDILGLRPGSAAGTNYVGFKGPATNPTASWTFQLPATEPASTGVVMAGAASSHVSGLTVDPAPIISAANMTNFPTLNQNSTGYSAAVAGGGANQVLIQTGSNTTGFCSIFVDGSTAISPTAASLNCGPTITNYGQAASNISITLPTPTATGQGFIASVGTAQASNYWRFTAGTAGTMYLDGGATGKDYMQFTAPAVGNYFVCFAQQTGSSTWRWNCKTGAGTVATN